MRLAVPEGFVVKSVSLLGGRGDFEKLSHDLKKHHRGYNKQLPLMPPFLAQIY